MAKTILFDDKNYSIDEAALAAASSELQPHLSTVMNGTGAQINLGGTAYNVDSTKLQAATDDFVDYLGTIAGEGSKVVVGGVSYSIDSTKLLDAVSSLHAAFGILSGSAPEEERLEGDGAEFYTLAPAALSFRSTAPLNEFQEVQINGQHVDPSSYTLEEGSTIVKLSREYLETLDIGQYDIKVVSANSAPAGTFTVVNAELNECGFYYNQPYCANVPYLGGDTAVFIRNDGTLDLIVIGQDSYSTDTCTHTFEDGKLVITDRSGVTFTADFSSAGYSAFVAELGATFELGNGLIAADMDYLYVYNAELGGYEAVCIDKTKAAYGQIKTGINGINTIRLVNHFLEENKNIAELPVIPNTVTTIGDYAFQNCTFLTHIGIPDGVTFIGSSAFNGCSGLESVHFGSGINTIDWYAFASCNSLQSAIYNGTVEQWQAINKGTRWCYETKLDHVQCSDGQVALQ